MKYRSRLMLGLLFFALLGLTACGRSSFECKDPLGCVSYPDNKPIRIATALSISGATKDLGLDSQYGVEIAIDMRGEISGHPIEVQAEDDGCSPEGGQAAAEKIVADPTIVAVIGSTCSGAGIPMAEIISEAGYVMISPSNTAPALTDIEQAWKPGYLRVAHNDTVQGRVMAEFAYNVLGVQTAAAIHDGDPYTTGLAQVFADSFTELGGVMLETAVISKGSTDMSPVLEAIASSGPPDFLYYPLFLPEGGFITRQAKELPALNNTILAAADGMITPDSIAALGEAGEGMYFSGPDLSFSGEDYENFMAAYKEKYNLDQPLAVYHAHAFDATNMVLDCIEDVAVETSDGLHIGRQALRACLYNTSDYPGLTGSLTCTEFGDCADPKISISQLTQGQFKRIWP